MLSDPRNTKLAEVFIDHSLKVQEGDHVVICASDFETMDLMRECYKLALDRGAEVYLDVFGWNYVLDRSSSGGLRKIFYEHASDDAIKNLPSIYREIVHWGEKFLRITSMDNYSHISGLDKDKISMNAAAYHDDFRVMIDEKDWVLTYYPTEAMAQKAGMSMEELFDFYFGAVLVDYDAMESEGVKVQQLLDEAKEVRVVSERTDLTINIEGRLGKNSCGIRNIPDGEVFYAPVHLKTEGHIYYDMPFSKPVGDIQGAYLEFKEGKVVKATAEQGEDVLLAGLNSDKGASYLGELGVGLNYGIQRVMKNTMFDEKIGGTLHITLGEAYEEERGGWPGDDRNMSQIHWDMVIDMRKPGSEIYVDGELKFKEGKWLV